MLSEVEVVDRYEDFTIGIVEAMAVVCKSLKLNLQDLEMASTPQRAAEWFLEFARVPDYEKDRQDFLSVTFSSPHKELVGETGLRFVALCPHHLLPYSGIASIAYIPSDGVVGISKLARALEYWTHCPVKQEDATANIADALMKYVKAQGCMVILEAVHTCMGHRGVRQPDHTTITSAVRGVFERDSDGCRTEWLRLLRK